MLGAAVALVLLALVRVSAPGLARGRGLALGALVALAAWTAVSISWAPIRNLAADETAQAALYAATFALALATLHDPGLRRLAVPALLAGVVVVALYTLAGRLLPDLIPFEVNRGRRRASPAAAHLLERARAADGAGRAARGVAGGGARPPGPRPRPGMRGGGALRRGALPDLLARVARRWRRARWRCCSRGPPARRWPRACWCSAAGGVMIAVLQALPGCAQLGYSSSDQTGQGAATGAVLALVTAAVGLGFARGDREARHVGRVDRQARAPRRGRCKRCGRGRARLA